MAVRTCIAVVLLISVLSACRSPSTVAPGYRPKTPLRVVATGSFTTVTAAELHQMLSNKDFVLINTHVPYEGELAATDGFVPFDQTEQQLARYPRDKTAKIVVYCRSGRMSTIAAATLVRAGYTNVWNLDQGMQGWEVAGYTVLQR